MKVLVATADKEKDCLEITLEGEDLGLANLVAGELVSNGSVQFAHAALDHPITANPVIRVKAKDAKKELVGKAAEKIAKQFAELLPSAPSSRKKKD